MRGRVRRSTSSGSTDRLRVLRFAMGWSHSRRLQLAAFGRTALGCLAFAPIRRWAGTGHVTVLGGLGDGIRLSVRSFPFAHAQGGLLLRGTLEPSVQETIRRLLPPGGVFYDIGANIGFFALLAARCAGAEGAVYAFEPAPSSAASIRENAEINGFENIEVIEKALGGQAGRGTLVLPADESWAHLSDRGWHPQARSAILVEVGRVDDLVREGAMRPPDLIKIDVEGSECDVISGMAETLREHRPKLICELHETNREFVQAMSAVGYAVSNLDGTAEVSDAPGDIHVLATVAGSGQAEPGLASVHVAANPRLGRIRAAT